MKDLLQRLEKLPRERLALLAARLQLRVDEDERARSEPIAVVGLSCRVPGGADSAESFLRLLDARTDAIGEVPADRWDVDALYDPDPDVPGKMASRWAGFLQDVESFDAPFFGISPREAEGMDPQQRLLLELCWEALEDGAQAPDRLTGSSTGVFVGISGSDHFLNLRGGGLAALDAYSASGSAHSVAAGRISFVLGLNGPSLPVDTACSSSLVAVHLAVRSLRSGECRMALTGGVNLILAPDTTIALSRSHMMAPDGRCKTFDARADGFVRGEGGGILVLKRLSDARADGDRVLAVIRGTAVNQDGRSNGLTAPNGPSQEAVIRSALVDARVEPHEVGYVEAHGTGTKLGDPIEVQAMAAALGAGRSKDRPLLIGSVKTNLGHLEAAAGVAGLIKAILAVQRGEIPPHLHLETPNPLILWDRLPVRVVTEGTAWERPEGGKRIAGVSSFGFSGTNAHVIVGEAPDEEEGAAGTAVAGVAAGEGSPERPVQPERPMHVVTLSARDEKALREQAGRYAAALAKEGMANGGTAEGGMTEGVSLADMAYSANVGRARFDHRAAVLARSSEEAIEGLESLRDGGDAGEPRGTVLQGVTEEKPRVAFLFTGQGAQRVGMGRELYEGNAVFRKAVERCAGAVEGDLEVPLVEVLYPAPAGEARSRELLDRTEYTQPALFAVEYGLAEVWQSWGVEPGVVMGHSVGEYVGAVVAGMVSVEEGMRLVTERGRLMGGLPAGGAMAAVFAGEARVLEVLEGKGSGVGIAAVNGPESVVVSGEAELVEAVLRELEKAGVTGRPLRVSHAFHSSRMDPVVGAMEQAAGGVSWQEGRIGIVSNVTGRMGGSEMLGGRYWGEHLRRPVRFLESMKTLAELGVGAYVEVGPDATLSVLGQRCIEGEDASWVASLRPGRGEWQQMVEGAGRLFVAGAEVDWEAFDRPWPRRRVSLPTYPFQRDRYPSRPSRLAVDPEPGQKSGHPLLGARLDVATVEGAVFGTRLGSGHPRFLSEHHVHDLPILPSPAYIEMALAAASEWMGEAAPELRDLVIGEALVLPEKGTDPVQTILESDGDELRLRIFSRGERAWTSHASARVVLPEPGEAAHKAAHADAALEDAGLAAARARCGRSVDPASYYRSLEELGLVFGPSFRGIRSLWRGDAEAIGKVHLPRHLSEEAPRYQWMHPALLDSCLHVVGAALPGAGSEVTDPFVLMAIDRIRFSEPADEEVWAHVRLRSRSGGGPSGARETLVADLRLVAASGKLIAVAEGLRFRRVAREDLAASKPGGVAHLLYQVAWREEPMPASAAAGASSPVHSPAHSNGNGRDAHRDEDRDFLAARALAGKVAPRFPETAAAHGMDGYGEMLPVLDRAASRAVVEALEDLGWSFAVGQSFTTEDLLHRCKVIARHERLAARLLEMLEEDGVLVRSGEGWRTDREPSPGNSEEMFAELRLRFPAFEIELELLSRCAAALSGVLKGAEDPLELLFPGGSLAPAAALYRETPSARTYNSVIRDTLVGVVEGLPKAHPLRVLEIGAGTGGTSAHILPELPPERTEYVFTDVSEHFLRRARSEFQAYPFMQFRELDIARDPAPQGFQDGTFDIIVAANVLHATPDLTVALRNVRRLLAPGGLLVLFEVMSRHRFADLTVGFTEGWWNYTDRELRTDYALLPRPEWERLLAETGFAAVATIPDSKIEETAGGQAVLLANADPTRPPVSVSGSISGSISGSVSMHPESDMRPESDAGTWLVLGGPDGSGEPMAAALRARGERCVVALEGEVFGTTGAEEFTVDPGSAASLQELLRGVASPLRGVVHMWGLPEEDAARGVSAELRPESPAGLPAGLPQLQQGVGSVLHLIQALARESSEAPPLVGIVTRGGQTVDPLGGEQTDPVQASIWGLSHTFALEHPEFRCTRIDLDPGRPVADAAGEVAEALLLRAGGNGAAADEDQMAFRGGVRRVRRLVRAGGLDAGSVVRFEGDATWLLTGGLGGLGLLVAEWMVGRGARHLILLGRSDPSGEAAQAISRMETLGAHIHVRSCDVSRREELEEVLGWASKELPPLKGIFHAAGVLDDGMLIQQDWNRFESVLGPKVLGAWHLHSLAGELGLPLEHFVLFSSGVGLLGAAGQGNHAAANAFLDEFAYHRRALGLPGVSVNWGAWSEVGAAAERGLGGRLTTFSPAEGLRALELTLAGSGSAFPDGVAQIAVLAVDWKRVLGEAYHRGGRSPLFTEIEGDRAEDAGGGEPKAPSLTVLEELGSAPQGRRRAALQSHIRAAAAAVLGLRSSEDVSVRRPLQELGLDSLMAVELRNGLSRDLQVSLPATLLFEQPSVLELTEFLAPEVLSKLAGQEPVEVEVPGVEAPTSGARDGEDREGDDPDGEAEGAGEGAGTEGWGDPVDGGVSEDELAELLFRRLEQLDADD